MKLETSNCWHKDWKIKYLERCIYRLDPKAQLYSESYEEELKNAKQTAKQKIVLKELLRIRHILSILKGGAVKNGSKPTQNGQNNNVVPFPIPTRMHQLDEWYKTASRDDVLELLNRVYDLKFLKGLNKKELEELLDYTIDTGGFGA